MLKRACYLGVFLGLAMMASGSWSHRAQGQAKNEEKKTDAKCWTTLEPGTCAAAGETHCRTFEICLKRECRFCFSPIAFKGSVCGVWEGSSCTPNGETVDCGAMNNLEVGHCHRIRGSTCSCHNPAPINKCGESSVYFRCKN
jgi:hypothetical protein